jgi:ribosomal protection tetracycline resistance protein
VSQKTLNLGILAHVDAGKTTLTERLLYETGVIAELGSVDAGTTQTDSLTLERQRGITIRSAVASFPLQDVRVNLIDTPGHPDFIAEVERVLSVLDGAVLVISAVEGVQPQTRILMRALQRLRIPTLIFVNKIDRPGASEERVLQAIAERLTSAIIPLGTARALGTRAACFAPYGAANVEFRARVAELLAERDEAILASYVEDDSGISYRRLRAELATQVKGTLVHPVFFGSAVTGAGVEPLLSGIAELLPASAGDPDGPVSGTVFKIERGGSGEKIAYVRMFSGTMHTRERLRFGRSLEDKVTAIAVFERGPALQRPFAAAGAVAKLWGLAEIQVGDRIGEPGSDQAEHQFPPPTLESVVASRDRGDRARLRLALAQLSEQDPLINVRQEDVRDEISISLYGEVQKEVIQATLAEDFGVEVTFRDTTTICVERPVGSGEALEELGQEDNPFLASIGLRVDPGLPGSGVEFSLAVDVRSIPLYVYKSADSFRQAMDENVRHTLQEGLEGWRVIDCKVTLTHCGYSSPGSSAADFRKLTPLVLMHALEQAGTQVCEPVLQLSVEMPSGAVSEVLPVLIRLGADTPTPTQMGDLSTIRASLPAARLTDLQRQLPGLTSGEGVLESDFVGYQPVNGTAPTRRRTTANPLKRKEYLLRVTRPGRAGQGGADVR